MDNKKLFVGFLTLAVGTLGAASVSVAAEPNPSNVSAVPAKSTMSMDAYGRITVDNKDIGDHMDHADKTLGEMYAGNNCYCTNAACDVREVRPSEVRSFA